MGSCTACTWWRTDGRGQCCFSRSQTLIRTHWRLIQLTFTTSHPTHLSASRTAINHDSWLTFYCLPHLSFVLIILIVFTVFTVLESVESYPACGRSRVPSDATLGHASVRDTVDWHPPCPTLFCAILSLLNRLSVNYLLFVGHMYWRIGG